MAEVQRTKERERGWKKYHADADEAIDGARDAGRAGFVDVASIHERCGVHLAGGANKVAMRRGGRARGRERGLRSRKDTRTLCKESEARW